MGKRKRVSDAVQAEVLVTSRRRCCVCFGLHHEGQVIVQVLDEGAIRFVQPNGECFDSVTQTAGDWRQLPAVHELAGIHIDARTAATRWDGGSMDYGLAMDALMYLRRDVSAET